MYCIYIYEESWMLYAIDAWNMMWSNSLVGLEITEARGSAIFIFFYSESVWIVIKNNRNDVVKVSSALKHFPALESMAEWFKFKKTNIRIFVLYWRIWFGYNSL